jgi:lipopolysaccharide export system protein LptC
MSRVKSPPPLVAGPAGRAPGSRPAPRRLPPPSRRREAPTAGQLARRRILVAVAKRVLPLAAVGLLATIALWPEFESAADRGRVAFKRVVQVRPEALRIVDPRYQGVDSQNRPYNVTAATAIQAGEEEVVQLQAPKADLLLADGGWLYLQAQEGLFRRGENKLDLEGRVTVHYDDGTQFVTEQAAVDFATSAAGGDTAVAAQGPFGTLTAEGFRILDRGQVVLFTGQSRVVLESTE